MISLIAAMAKNSIIGRDNDMPWHMPADLKHFKELTSGKPVIMGRRTFESIGRPLPNRPNLIVTRNTKYKAEGCSIFHSVEDAIKSVEDLPEIMIIGGAAIYEQAMPLADRMYLTYIDLETKGDTKFPEWVESDWKEIERIEHLADVNNPHNYAFITLDRT